MPVPTAPSQATGLLLPVTWGRDWNFFDKITVSNTGFNPTADMIITFTTAGVIMTNFGNGGTGVLEVSFNGLTTHMELYPIGGSNVVQPTVMLNRVVSKIWFRVQSGSSGSIVVSVNAWSQQ
jgi:hypothetical protein